MATQQELALEAQALRAQGKFEAAIEVRRRAVAAAPTSAVAEHNLASALGDAGRWREAEPHARQALAKGGDAPEMHLVLARALQGQGRYDEAERSFLAALSRRPTFYDAHKDLAQLRWMRSGDLSMALKELDEAMRTAPVDLGLQMVKAKVLTYAGQTEEAHALLARLAAAHPDAGPIVLLAAQSAAEIGADAEALTLSERAARLMPQESVATIALVSARLALGDAMRAAVLLEDIRRREPNNQHAIALQATAWRLLNDPRYRALYDYERFVGEFELDTPKTWPSLDAYIADLAAGLKGAHGFSTHPFDQSIRKGSQAPDILRHDHPAIAALPEALDGPIRIYIASIGQGSDPLRARNSGGYAFQGMWSIRMRTGGFHIDHVHPQGWVSSACYVETPSLEGKSGWLKLGQPGVRTKPALEPERYVKPAPGKLVLFPSYMWHGAVPFTDDATRMTVAFDLAPA